MKIKTEPEIVSTAQNLLKKFFVFFGKNLYFVIGLFLLNFLYKYLIFKFIPTDSAKLIVDILFDLSFYPIMMIFTMYVVNSYYAGKKITNFQEFLEEGKAYFMPLLLFYVLVFFVRSIIPPQLNILTIIILVKLAFVDQLIYYRNYSVFEAMKMSCRLTTMRITLLFFVSAFFLFTLAISLFGYLSTIKFGSNMLILAVQTFIFIVIRFFITVSYRELIKEEFYRSRT